MHAFPLYVFSKNFKGQHPVTDGMFFDKNPWCVRDKLKLVSLKKPRFRVGDRVVIQVGRVPKNHNTGYTLDEGIAVIKAIDVLDNGISAKGVHTRVMYKIEFEEAVGWKDIDSDWKATEVVVQESSLMVRA